MTDWMFICNKILIWLLLIIMIIIYIFHSQELWANCQGSSKSGIKMISNLAYALTCQQCTSLRSSHFRFLKHERRARALGKKEQKSRSGGGGGGAGFPFLPPAPTILFLLPNVLACLLCLRKRKWRTCITKQVKQIISPGEQLLFIQ